MTVVVKYPVLESQIVMRGIKKTVIAATIGCSSRAFTNKCSGKSQFTWNEVQQMNSTFFPDIPPSELMRTER